VGKVLRGIGNESDNGREAVDEDAVLEVIVSESQYLKIWIPAKFFGHEDFQHVGMMTYISHYSMPQLDIDISIRSIQISLKNMRK
jgi:hypothetical protein